MLVVYDDIHEITRDLFVLIRCLHEKGVIGDFGGDYKHCGEGKITMKKDSPRLNPVLEPLARKQRTVSDRH